MSITGRYEHVDGSTNKFWSLEESKNGFIARWGRIGTAGQGPKEYTKEEAEKLVKEKLKKGYKLVG